MSISGISARVCYQSQSAVDRVFCAQEAEGEQLAVAFREDQDSQPSLAEMMKDAREKAAEREKMFKLPQNSRRYGDAAILAYSKLAQARNLGQVDAAAGYARRQIAQLRAAKRSDSDNADRIQAAIKTGNFSGKADRQASSQAGKGEATAGGQAPAAPAEKSSNYANDPGIRLSAGGRGG